MIKNNRRDLSKKTGINDIKRQPLKSRIGKQSDQFLSFDKNNSYDKKIRNDLHVDLSNIKKFNSGKDLFNENLYKKTFQNREIIKSFNSNLKQEAKRSANVKNYNSLSKSKSSDLTQNSSSVNKKDTIRIMFLGGLNEIGKNMTLFESNGDMFLLDCGMTFPDGEMLGVDLVIPDFSYLERNIDKIKGVVLTHGHEDHIGAIPYLLRKFNLPLYGTALTLGLVGEKLVEHGLYNRAKLNIVKAGQSIKLGCMDIDFIHVNHSIPDAVGIAIHSPAGTIVHTGDFKIDCTPTQGEMIDLAKFAELGNKGVLALMSDSTNAGREGYTMTEKKVAESFETLFQKGIHKRIIIASFASNINRIQEIIKIAFKFDRKVAFSGRSMINYVKIAKSLGYLKVPDGVLIDIDEVKKYLGEQIVLVTTGSQGEPMSALSRMANSDHRKVMVGPNDMIIISAKPIPGNEKMVNAVINELLKKGCEVVYESMYEVHVSGHACQEELKIIHSLVKPKYFIPVHGEQMHLIKQKELAESMGMPSSRIFIGNIGSAIELSSSGMRKLSSVPAGRVFVDGLGVGDVGSIVLRDRKHLGQDGLIVVVVTINPSDGKVVSGPDIVSRGFVYVRESEPLIDCAKERVSYVLNHCAVENIHEWGIIKNKIKEDLSKLFFERTRRNPMILPIIMEI